MTEIQMPRPGEVCPSCKDAEAGPKTLVTAGTTQNHKMVVAVCPYCDGERLLEVRKETDERLNGPGRED